MRALLSAGGISLFITLFATPGFIWAFRKLEWGQFIRDDGPKTHHTKRGTPTMGGIVILLAATVAYFSAKWLNGETPTATALLVIFMMLGLGLVGFIDDYLKVRNQRSLGLSGWAKIAGQGVVAIIFAVLALQFPDEDGLTPASTNISLFRDLPIDLFFWGSILGMGLFILWVYLLVASASNGVNIADGLDGLASGSAVLAIGAYVVIGFWQFNQSCATVVENIESCYQVRDPLDIAVIAAAIGGACLGFLWWNTSPAQLFMGDTGSLGLGGALAALAILSRTELLLILIGGIFVIVTGSVVIQRVFFKITKWRTGTGKRVFLMSPLHHHFELKGWAEITVVVRFWIIAALSVVSGVGLFYIEWIYN
ncbi:phospho-N-acetylmuramoyl-pentapeptide-transferase [Candidatus Aquiluna sp. UB-MaderosW2red]|uniref:phospho-N-acetylmuramoyl-pentapeptide- transferase n=1 Tax=Candidatus Aquiluna sp. UB-MaderosW2red TaxID=1855377 RepID=UPI000875CF02|nr:phospho-N-acetylmuramoyl-pentapeptide-transferase [Candidatus Aquiluna sp. UB-MaderosW2red]SCX12649.1 phospho-N-acetylmuramoyl-pentapeptide-transferase [Candidatus Aquiluna sp. UB-MaderosW2red]